MKNILKATILAALIGLMTRMSYGQGSIDLNTFDANNFAGAGMKIQTDFTSFNAPAGTQIEIFGGASAGSLAPLVSASPANAGVAIYTLVAGDVNANGNGSGVDYGYAPVAGVAPGGTGFFVIEAWLAGTGGGNTYATAQYNYISPVFTSVVGSVIATPPAATSPGALNFSGQIVITYSGGPEPSTMALAGVGAAVLLLFRRRK